MLALAPGMRLHRDVLLDVLWPDLDPDAAANQLHKTVHFLRRALEPDGPGRAAVITEREWLRLPEGTVVDALELLAHGPTALRGGDADEMERILAGAEGPFLQPYAPWAAEIREHVERLRLRLLRQCADLRLAGGDPDAAEVLGGRILALDPGDEATHRLLMSVHAARGDWRSAIAQYERCRTALAEDLGVEPSPETEAMRRDVLASMIAAAPAPATLERATLLEQLGDAVRESGDARQAGRLYADALALHGASEGEPELRINGKLALVHIITGDVAAAEAQLGPIAEGLAREWPALVTARTLYLLSQLRWHSGRYRDALEAAEGAIRAARAGQDPEQQARAQEAYALACHALGDWPRGMEAELERQRIAAETGFGFDEVLEAHMCLWEYSLYGDRPFDEVERAVSAALERAETSGRVAAMAVAEHALGSIQMTVGRWPEAHRTLARSVRLARSVGAPQGTVLGLQRLALLETIAGDLEGGHQRVLEALQTARTSSSAQVQYHSFSRMHGTLALNRFLAGDLPAARAALGDGTRVQREAGECITCDSLIHPVAVPIHLAAGDLDAAKAECDRTEATATSFRGASRTAQANLVTGLVLAAKGIWRDADTRLARAAASFERANQPYELARSLAALGAVRAAGGEPGSAAIRDQADGLLRGLGADPDPDRLGNWLVASA